MQADPHGITATPAELRKAQRTTSKQPSNVVDVVNDRIMLGMQQMDMDRFTTLTRASDPNSAAMYRRLSASNYTPNNTLSYQAINQQSQLPNAMDISQADMSITTNYMGDDSKDFFNSVMGPSHAQPQPTERNPMPPVSFHQPLKTESVDCDEGGGSSASVLQQLLSPDSNNLSIQEIESLLGMGKFFSGK